MQTSSRFSDVLDFDSFECIALKVKDIVGDKGLNILINNAGILRGKKDSLSLMNAKDMTDTYLTNTVAPVLLTKVRVLFVLLFFF